MSEETHTQLTYRDHEGVKREVRGCTLTVDKFGRHFIWSEQLQHNLVYKNRGREDAFLAAIDSLLFTIKLKDDQIRGLKRIADLAEKFAEEVNGEDQNDCDDLSS